MNFYATPEYLAVVAEVFFKGRRTAIEDVRIGDEVLRLLIVDDKHVITRGPFLDYHEPLRNSEIRAPSRTFTHAPWVTRRIVERAEWNADAFRGHAVGPFVDWSKFPTFADYKALIRARNKGVLAEHDRRRSRLLEALGELRFCMDDEDEEVFALARRWKSQQLLATGQKDYFAEPKNVEYFRALRRRGLLTASTLRAGGRLLSVWVGFVHDRVWSGWIFTYNPAPALKKYSLGHQLLHKMLEESHRRGHREFDFSIGDESYKWLYATHARILGPIGRAPLHQRLVAGAKGLARRAFSQSPNLLRFTLALRRAL